MSNTRRPWRIRDFGLSIALLSAFLLLAILQTVVGRRALGEDLREHGAPPLTYRQYLATGVCWESLAENWESEFLEMGAFVWLTSFLFQRGSPESRDPDASDEPDEVRADSPWPARKGGWILTLYANSLSLGFVVLFLASLAIHAVAGASAYNHDQALHGQPPVSTLHFLTSSNFWFQSLQNWQSEFLGIASMVLLSIWLRQRGSQESKPVGSPHWENE